MSTNAGSPRVERVDNDTRAGDLAARLLGHAVDLTRHSGPEAVSLREVQRRSGVSPAAAYKHYRDRAALMVAVGQRASAMLAEAIERSFAGVESRPDKPAMSLARLRAGMTAYIDFALRDPGLYRAVFLTDEDPADLSEPALASRGGGGLGPYQLLQNSIGELVNLGEITDGYDDWSDTAVWAASHGMALLLLDSPLRKLDTEDRGRAVDRLVDLIVSGLTRPGG